MHGFDGRFDALEHRMDGLDRRIDGLSGRIDALDAKVDHFREELGARITAQGQDLGGRIQALDQKLSHHFIWTVGVQVAVLLAVVAALAGR